ATLQAWLETYLGEVERQNGIAVGSTDRPPSMSTDIYGALDDNLWESQNTPAVIVVAQPTGNAESPGTGQWDQWYDLTVYGVIATADASRTAEAHVRGVADVYGAAIMAAIMQDRGTVTGTLATVAQRTRLTSTPTTEFFDPEMRNIARAVCRFRTLVEAVVDEMQAPAQPVPDQSTPPAWPTVTSTDLTLDGVALDEDFT
ncbi:MAG: hypothetical protein ACRDNS_02145, partial [Trebonia sp.]